MRHLARIPRPLHRSRIAVWAREARRRDANQTSQARVKERSSWLVAGLIFVLMACTIDAQERFGGLTGTVMDASKAAVPGATVTATNKETGAQRVVVSGADGTYRVPDLDPGRYSVTIELQSFPESRRRRSSSSCSDER